MNIEEKVKNLEGCLNQTNKRLDGLKNTFRILSDLVAVDYCRMNKRLKKLETPPKKWWQRIRFEI